MYDCILELSLPTNECKQYELWDKYTNKKLKTIIFTTTDSLRELDSRDFDLMLSKEEKLSMEFHQYVLSEEMKERVEKGLPIKLILGRKGGFNAPKMVKKGSTPNIHFHQSIIEKPLDNKSAPNLVPNLDFNNNLTASSDDIDNPRSRSGSFNNTPVLPLMSPPSSGRKRAGTSSINSSSPLAILSPRSSSSSSSSSPNSSPSNSPTTPTQGRFKSLFKSNSSSTKISAFSKSMSEIKRNSGGDFRNNNNNNNNNNSIDDGESEFENIVEIPAPPEDALLIEQNQFGYHFELGYKTMDSLSPNNFFLEIPRQENLFTKYFAFKDHKNYAGEVEGIGPVFISIIEEKDKKCTRGLVRIPQRTYHICSESTQSKGLKLILSRLNLNLPVKAFKRVKVPELIPELEKFDQSHIVTKYKFGVLYCKEGQISEEQWFSNEHASPNLYEFMDLIGTRITLSGWSKFRGGLDVNTNTTGVESYYTEVADNEVMFHVSTLLPYSEADEQKIERKRHLGNDIVVIIYKEGNTKFTPSICKSVFNHCYIVVSKEANDMYRVELAIKDGVKSFGPYFPSPSLIPKNLIKDFLLTKMLNAEWAAYRSLEFSHKFKRTRQQQLNAMFKSLSQK